MIIKSTQLLIGSTAIFSKPPNYEQFDENVLPIITACPVTASFIMVSKYTLSC